VKRIAICLILLLAAGALAWAGANPQVQTTTLPNGLTVLVKEMHGAPVVSAYVWYRVGSRNEYPGRTGISHLLEHMTFKGSAHYGKGVVSRLITQKGGWENGMTWLDWTAYVFTLPSKDLDLALAIHADRMASLTLDPKELEAEKTVVLSELQGDENSPGFFLDTAVRGTAYLAHPYMFRTIGYQSDLRSYTREDLLEWYHTYYSPANATLVVVGDVQAQDVFARARKYFGRIPRRPAPPAITTVEPPQEGERRVIVRRPGAANYVEIAYHIPAVRSEDLYALDVAEGVLSSGRTSRLYRALVEKGLAADADAWGMTNRDPSLFTFSLTLQDGVTHQQGEQALLAVIDDLRSNPPSERELQKALNQARASFVYAMDSVSDQAYRLGYYQTIDDYRYLDTYLERIGKVTAADVQRVAARYFTPDNRTVGWFIPTGMPTGPGGAESRPGPAQYRDGHPQTATALGPLPPARAAEAKPAAAAAARPAPTRVVLPNGIVLVVQENHTVPAVAISGMLRAGSIYDPPGKAGLANLVAAGTARGTTTRTFQQMAEELEFVAATVGLSGGIQVAQISGQCLAGDLDLTVGILADQLRHATFPAEEVNRLLAQAQVGLQEAEADTDEVAERDFYATLYPEGHPLHYVSQGNLATVRTITRQDMVDFYQRYYRPDGLILVVVGDVQPAEVQRIVEKHLGDWQAQGKAPAITLPAPPLPARPQAVLREVPGKTQASIILGASGLSRRSPDYPAALLANYILGGGGFASRLTATIRDEQGLAYSVGSTFRALYEDGPWLLYMGVNPANADKAVKSALEGMRGMQQAAPGAKEMQLWKDYAAGSLALRLETNEGVAANLADAEFYGLGLDYPYRLPGLIAAVTPEQVLAASRTYFHPDDYVLVKVGTGLQK